MAYVDGYLLPVPVKKVDAYRQIARKAGRIWKEHGALQYWECVADHMETGFGVPFPKRVKVKPGETVIFAWVVFKSRAHRDRVNAKVMKDPRIAGMDACKNTFDYKRMSWGGFEPIVML